MKYLFLFLLLTLSFLPEQADAFCRTTTCDESISCDDAPKECCRIDSEGCIVGGKELYWPTSCISFSTDKKGSVLRNISAEQMSETVENALSVWLEQVDCGGSRPTLSCANLGLSECGVPTVNSQGKYGNTNEWLFSDSTEQLLNSSINNSQVISSNTLALSTVSFDYTTGEIFDVDVDFNSAEFEFSNNPSETSFDLASVVAHEAGHFLGLADPFMPTSTMALSAVPGDTSKRTLTSDDKQGICDIYAAELPNQTNSCEPEGGYSTACVEKQSGCSLGYSAQSSSTSTLWFLLGTILLMRRQYSRYG